MRALDFSDPAEREQIRQLFERNGFPRTTADIDWLYRQEGDIPPIASVTDGEAGLTGLYAAIPARMQVDGETVACYQSIDTMIDASARGQGLFTKLANHVYERMAKAGSGAVWGFPNGNSHHGFIKHLGWQSLDPVPFLFRPLTLSFPLRRVLRMSAPDKIHDTQEAGLTVLPPAAEVDALWQAMGAALPVARIRDHAYLAGRYCDKPGQQYRLHTLRDGDRLVALAITILERNKHGGDIAYLMEFLVHPDASISAGRLLGEVISELRRDGADGILAWCFPGSPTYRHLRDAWFLPIPERLRPVELHFGYRCFAADPSRFGNPANWYISYSDSDTV